MLIKEVKKKLIDDAHDNIKIENYNYNCAGFPFYEKI